MPSPALAAVLLLSLPLPAPPGPDPQGGGSPPPGDEIETIVVTPLRSAGSLSEAPFSVDAIDEEELRRRGYRTLPQMLRNTPGVMVQETSHGQGSPFLRGFTGFRTLLLVDGIRLNHSAMRSGPNQYWNTVDPYSLDRLEAVLGPGSVLWGSDAIGGTVNAITLSPRATEDDPTQVRLQYKFASAERSHVGRLEVSQWLGSGTSALVGVTPKHFGNVEGGADTGTQFDTGYDELDADVKIEHWLDGSSRLVLAHQTVSLDDVPRTHSTQFAKSFEGTTIGSDLRRNLDQDRDLTYLQFHDERPGDEWHASLSVQRHQEVRDRIRSNGRQEFQGFDLTTFGLWLQRVVSTGSGRWTFGVDTYYDDVDSFKLDTSDPTDPVDAIQGPVADDSNYLLTGIYAQNELALAASTSLVLGARFEYASAESDSALDPTDDSQTRFDEDWSALVGSARVRHELDESGTWALWSGVAQGFRAPNLSDLSRLDSSLSGDFEIPSPDVDPEHYLSYEVGVQARTVEAALDATVFYTDIDDQILRFPTGALTADGETIVTKDNVGDGHVWGIELSGSRRIARHWTLFGASTWLDGEITNFAQAGAAAPITEPISRLMPWTSHVGVRWDGEEDGRWIEAMVVHAEDADELSLRDQSDTQRIPPGGTPGYTVGHVRGGWQPSDRVQLVLGVENVTDEDYRIHGSGLNMPGTNFTVSCTVRL